jgi:hypothetical protein
MIMKKATTLFLLFLLIACSGGGGGDGAGPPAPPTVDATGTWRGPYTSTLAGSHIMTVNIKQTGATLTATYSSTAGVSLGSVTGTVSGDTINFTITVTTPGCSGSFVGDAVIDDTQPGPATMSIQYDGSSTCGGQESGTGNLTKQ